MAGTVVFIEASSGDGGDPGATASKVVDGSTVTGWVSSASVATNGDIFLTGSSSISDKVSATNQDGYGTGAGLVGEPWDFSVGGTDEGNHVFMIANIGGTPDTLANGGFGIVVADDLATDSVGYWYVGPQAGSLAGWEYFVIDPAQDFDQVTAGSATWTLTGNPAQLTGVDGIGVRWSVQNTVMGASDNCFLQSMSIGVGYRITGTDAVFSEITTYEATNRFGAIQLKSGTVFPLCKIRVGTPSGAGNTTFNDSGFTVIWQGQTLSDGTSKATAAGFYGFFADQGTGTTDITLDAGTLAASAPETFDLALAGVNSVNITNLAVDRARIVTLDSAVDWDGGSVRNSGQITATDAIFTNVQVLTSTVAADTGALVWNSAANPDGNLDGCEFSKGTNAHHAIDFGTLVTGNITLRNIAFSGFGSTNDANDSTVRFLATTGSLTLSLIGCTVDGAAATTSNFSVDDAAGIAVTLSIDPVTTLVNITDETGANEAGVRVYLQAADATGDLPFEQSITSITRSGTVATVTFGAAHGLVNNEYLKIKGITDKIEDNAGAHQVTVTGTTTLTYTTTDSGSTNYTGTLTGTGVTIYGTTDASGNISSARTYGSNQPLTGYARKASGAPYYKVIEIDATVNSATGLSISRRLVLDQ